MREELLAASMVAQKMKVNDLLIALKSYGVSMSRSAFYKKKNGSSDFTRLEIQAISKVLKLPSEKVLEIFLVRSIVKETH
ncbi:hypothetical protein AUF12_07535 [Enterococcus avium]|uniref:hypothetical protein n=1 Tax=Enterococcus avium TaxID=33945 RepID=UPI000C9BE5C5|nr:hypothetical protein [Enterococcus avium]PNE48968.1 hypothetical protein AUF12_16455 [Enterococcus avium]PNE50350.1 hypothetical protein AUF12_07535 [Enterococcus avium]